MKEIKRNQNWEIKPARKFAAAFKRYPAALQSSSGKSARQIGEMTICHATAPLQAPFSH